MNYLGAFPLLETLFFFFRKSLVILLPYWKITLFLTSHSRLGPFYYFFLFFTYQRTICMYKHQLNSCLFGIKIEQQSFLETSKPLCRIHIAICNASTIFAHIPHILHHMHWTSLPLGSKYTIGNLQTLTKLKICLWQQILTFLWFFCEGLAPILFITSLSKDKVTSVEKPYADFTFYENVNNLSPIESIKTKRCLLLGT